MWPTNAFLTVTFRDECLPKKGVTIEEHQLFMKNLRAQWHHATGQYFRFYMCGEYGEKTFRPHYHYALFNFPPCQNPNPWRGRGRFIPCNCNICRFVSKVWGKGHVFIGYLEPDSAQYIAGYVTKKMTKKDDKRLAHEVVDPDTGEVTIEYYHPEFSKQSRNPGIARAAVNVILDAHIRSAREELPSSLRQGSRMLPLGRYLKGKLQDETNQTPLSADALHARQMLSLLKDSKNDTIFPRAIAQGSAAVAMRLVNAQRALKIEQRFQRKGSI